jgi:hypothetical protein
MTPGLTVQDETANESDDSAGDGVQGDHVDQQECEHHEDLPRNTMANAERWAGGLSGPAYAIDDETAIKVVDGTVDVVSEGHWKLFTPSPVASESG